MRADRTVNGSTVRDEAPVKRSRLSPWPFPRSMGLRWRILAWFVVPTALVLVAVAVVNFFAYQKVTADLVLERDKDLVRLSAVQLSASFRDYEDRLTSVARDTGVLSGQVPLAPGVLQTTPAPLVVFDGGALLLSRNGTVVDEYPSGQGLLGQSWPAPEMMAEMLRTSRPVYSGVLNPTDSSGNVVAVAVPIIRSGGQLDGAIIGMFDLGETSVSAFYGGIVRLRLARSGSVYLVDSGGRVVYHTNPEMIGKDLSRHSPVARVLTGNVQSIRTDGLSGKPVVAAFAPVPGTTWGLVSEEDWGTLSAEAASFQRWLILLLVLGDVALAGIVVLGLKRLMRPVNDLNRAAVAVGAGDYGRQVSVRSTDEIGRLGAAFNRMSLELKSSYEELEERVEERTRELRASELRYTELFEQSLDAIFITDACGVIQEVNLSAGQVTGLMRDEMVGARIEDWVVQDEAGTQAINTIYEQLVEGPGELRDFETKLRRKDGSVIDCAITARRRPESEGGGFEAIIRDITARKQTEEELFGQTRELAVVDERNRMAREIHDTLAQGLTGIVLQLEAAQDFMKETDPGLEEHIERAKSLARESLTEARRSVWNLSPSSLEERSLMQALQEEIEKFDTRGNEYALFQVAGVPVQMARETEVALLRICQEALMNVRKYARAKNVSVVLDYEPGEVILRITDDGRGFDPDSVALSRQGGFGLSSMRRRAQVEGGTLDVETSEGLGTVVTARIPV